MFDFVKTLIQIRKEHPILHLDNEFRMMDYISCGYPDMSYHGTKAWYPDFSNYSRVIGILIAGDYPTAISTRKTKRNVKNKKIKDNYFYFAYNMHWEKHDFELPKLPNDLEWSVLVDTSVEQIKENNNMKDLGRVITVNDRSIVVFMSKKKELEKNDKEVNSKKSCKNMIFFP